MYLGKLDRAEPLLDRALALGRSIGPGFENQLARILNIKCNIFNMRSEFARARLLCQEAVDTINRSPPPNAELDATVRYDLAYMMLKDGAPEDNAERLIGNPPPLRSGLAAGRALTGPWR